MPGQLNDGYRSIMTFSLNANVKVYPKTVTPFGASAGGAIDTTTMLNNLFRTFQPKKLQTITGATLVGAYDPALYNDIMAMLGKNQLLSIIFPDLGHFDAYGWIDEASFSALTEGVQPEVTFNIMPSNQNGSGAEAGPSFTAGSAPTTTTTPAPITTTTAAPAP